jgi:hypothetical protein
MDGMDLGVPRVGEGEAGGFALMFFGYLLKTFFSRSVVLAAGLVRMAASSLAT